jgi:DNA repair exonuclease SbcCD ATPase subunit
LLAGAGFLCLAIICLAVRPALPFGSEPVPSADVVAPSGQVQTHTQPRLAPIPELTAILATATDRLEELATLTTKAVAASRKLDALKARERNVIAELRAVHADRSHLREARDGAIARTEELGKALEQATSITHALGVELAAERQANSRSRAREAEWIAQHDDLESHMELAETELASLRARLEDSQERLANAAHERGRAEAKLVDFEERSAEDRQGISALQAHISALQQELESKDGALKGLVSLRTESDELRHRLAATEANLKRQEDENDRLSSELVVFRRAAKAATDMAQQHLLTVEVKIRELSEVANLKQLSEQQTSPESKAQSASGPEAASDLIDARAASALSAEGEGGLEASQMGKADSYQLIAPAQAAEERSESSLQIRMRDALLRQREHLEGLMKNLDGGREGSR